MHFLISLSLFIYLCGIVCAKIAESDSGSSRYKQMVLKVFFSPELKHQFGKSNVSMGGSGFDVPTGPNCSKG